MAVLRAGGPGFLGERFMAESPLSHCAQLAVGEAGLDQALEVAISVSLAPWREWQARLADCLGFLGQAEHELRQLRSRYAATSLVLDFPLHRALGALRQEIRCSAELLTRVGHLGIDLALSYLPPDFSGSSERHPRILVDPAVCGGRPVIRGSTVLVRNLVDALAAGQSLWQIRQDFPDIGAEDVAAAVAFIAEQAEHA